MFQTKHVPDETFTFSLSIVCASMFEIYFKSSWGPFHVSRVKSLDLAAISRKKFDEINAIFRQCCRSGRISEISRDWIELVDLTKT